MPVLAPRTIATDTNLDVCVQHSDPRDGGDPRIVYLVIDGECYALSKYDANRIAAALTTHADSMKHGGVS